MKINQKKLGSELKRINKLRLEGVSGNNELKGQEDLR